MSKVSFRPEFWELINKVSNINNEIVIQKGDEGSNVISHNNTVMGALLKINEDLFDYDEEIVIANFKEFNTVLNTIGDYTLDIQGDSLLTFNTPESDINYGLGDIDAIEPTSKGPIAFNYGEEGAAFEIDEITLKKIQTLIKLLLDKEKSDNAITSKAVVTVAGDTITIDFKNTGGTLDAEASGNSFDYKFDNLLAQGVDGVATDDEPYVYEINPDFFLGLPGKSDYRLALKPADDAMKLIKAETTFRDDDDEIIGECMFLVGVFK